MAKGSIAKEEITVKLLECFPNAFKYEKELRIPWKEDGVDIEIKVALTCAKTNVGGNSGLVAVTTETSAPKTATAPTPEEKRHVEDLMSRLGLLK